MVDVVIVCKNEKTAGTLHDSFVAFLKRTGQAGGVRSIRKSPTYEVIFLETQRIRFCSRYLYSKKIRQGFRGILVTEEEFCAMFMKEQFKFLTQSQKYFKEKDNDNERSL